MARAAVDTAGVEAAVAEVVILRAAVEAAVAQVVIVEAAVVGVVVVKAVEEAVEAAVVGAVVAEVVMMETAVAAVGAPVVAAAVVVDPLGTAYRKCNRSSDDSSMRSRATSKKAGSTRMGGLSGSPSFLIVEDGRTLHCLRCKRPEVS